MSAINGLAIGDASILTCYQGNIVGGSGSLAAEINPVPEPASMALLGAGLVALGLVRRRRA